MFKLRAFLESSGGDYALGVEAGMQRAADMVENALRRHRGLCSQELLSAIVGEVRRFSPHEQNDDITLIVAKGR